MLSPLGEDSNPFAMTPTVFPVKTGLYSRTGRVTKVTLLTIMFNYAYKKHVQPMGFEPISPAPSAANMIYQQVGSSS